MNADFLYYRYMAQPENGLLAIKGIVRWNVVLKLLQPNQIITTLFRVSNSIGQSSAEQARVA
jgi:hypothetical protein